MSKLVVLSLGQGTLYDGFPAVTAQIGEVDNPYRTKFTASLPPAPEIANLYRGWKSLYSAFYQSLSLRHEVKDDDFEIEEAYITNVSQLEFTDLCQQLALKINAWLNSTEFRKIDQQLRTRLKPSEEVRFVIETNDNLLRRLPWHLWDFFEDYPLTEVALSAAEYQQSYKTSTRTQITQVRILAIFGNSVGINLSQDRAFLEKLSNRAEIEFLVEPNFNHLNNQLWQQSWDILFFAGHSFSQEKGHLQINQTETITLDKLKYGLKQAISKGLKLAIFNSCDGLGLAQQLQDLQIPQVIVMREPVPDVIAQEFLKHLLNEFSQGRSLYVTVRSARERLQGLETEYPCATWLPIICQNPAEPPMIWQEEQNAAVINKIQASELVTTAADMTTRDFYSETLITTKQKLSRAKIRNHRLQILFIASLLVTASVMGWRHLGMLQPWELQAYDHMIQLRPTDEKPDSRLLIVTVDEADIQYQIRQKMNMRWSLSDQALSQLLQKLERFQPVAIGLDIYRDFPIDPNHQDIATRLQKDERLFGVCKVSAPRDGAPDGVPPPPELSKKRLSFSDFVADADAIPRRQLLQLTPPVKSPCAAEYALSFQLAQYYLNAKGIHWKINSQGNLQIGNTVFKQLTSYTSGYQGADASGYQVLLNYRSVPSLLEIAQKVALREILENKVNSELVDLVKNRIVLIGVTASTTADYWETPYSAIAPDEEKEISGVYMQAQMVSHILSAVLDGRPLLWWWSGWVEALWVWGWSLLGGLIAWRFQQPLYLGLTIFIALLTLFGICFSIFTKAGWIPLVPSTLALVSCAVVLKILPLFNVSSISNFDLTPSPSPKQERGVKP